MSKLSEDRLRQANLAALEAVARANGSPLSQQSLSPTAPIAGCNDNLSDQKTEVYTHPWLKSGRLEGDDAED